VTFDDLHAFQSDAGGQGVSAVRNVVDEAILALEHGDVRRARDALGRARAVLVEKPATESDGPGRSHE
jgi:hypothetical protein